MGLSLGPSTTGSGRWRRLDCTLWSLKRRPSRRFVPHTVLRGLRDACKVRASSLHVSMGSDQVSATAQAADRTCAAATPPTRRSASVNAMQDGVSVSPWSLLNSSNSWPRGPSRQMPMPLQVVSE